MSEYTISMSGDDDDRHAFLKGILVGVAIRKAVEALEQTELTEEEMRINYEIEKLGLSR